MSTLKINDSGTIKEPTQIFAKGYSGTLYGVNYVIVNNSGTLNTVWNAIYNTSRDTTTSFSTTTSANTTTTYTTTFATGTSANTEVVMINGRDGDNLWRYDSPTFSGVSVHASYLPSSATGTENNHADLGHYSDVGIQIAPEMVEGLSIGYATAELEESATVTVDESTLWIKYTNGPISVGYQTSEADGSTSTQDDEATLMSISYAVTDDLSISYGTAEVDLGSSTTDQESKGLSASYTMGGVSISVAMNSTDNVGGSTATAHDVEGYDLNVAFAF